MPQLDILFQDDYIMVINKPPSLIVTPTETSNLNSLSEILISDYKISLDRGGIVHRLDKDTSGLILVAKTQNTLEGLQAQFQSRLIKKEYLCLVHGLFEKEILVSKPIERNQENREKFVVSMTGKEAVTKFSLIQYYQLSAQKIDQIFAEFNKIQLRKLNNLKYSNFSLVQASPQTGRTHQIRVHLKYLGYPIVSDEKYGGRKIVRLDKRWCPRQFLHASKIEFTHPESNKLMEFKSGIPSDLQSALFNLNKI